MIKVFAITSGKGGVGKSNIVANLAVALAEYQQKVLVLDADLGLANIDIIFGIKPELTINDVLNGTRKISDIIVEGPAGVHIIPATSGISEILDLTTDQKMTLLNAFDGLEREYDVMLVDTGAGISVNVMYFNVASHEILVVVNKEPTSITDAYALMKVMNEKYAVSKFNLLVNNAKNENEAFNVYKAISSVANRFLTISIDYFGYIPHDENLQKAVLQRKPLKIAFPQSPAALAFNDIAKRVIKMDMQASQQGNIQFFWKKIVELSHG